jgi:hypothetical protein
MTDPTTLRHQLLAAGYCPLPLRGKKAFQDNWTKRTDPSSADIDNWALHYPDAPNTGLLTRLMPTLDIDITDPAAAETIEMLARERFEERGHVLSRIGKPPKIAIPFRTNEPFKKLSCSLIAPNGDSGQKIELLCDGQQVVCDGIHPETQQPYRWYGGAPGAIKYEDLPYLHPEEAKALVDDAVELLCRDFSYQRAPPQPEKEKPRERTNYTADDDLSRQWGRLNQIALDRLDAWVQTLYPDAKRTATGGYRVSSKSLGRNLEEDLSFSPDGIKDFGRADMGDPRGGGRTPIDAVIDRFNCDFKYAVSWLAEALGEDPQKYEPRKRTNGHAAQSKANGGDTEPLLISRARFVEDFIAPDYLVDGILQRRFFYSLTAVTGGGKTAIALALAQAVGCAEAATFGGRYVERGQVIYFVGENPDDVRARLIGADAYRSDNPATDRIHFIVGVFNIEEIYERVAREIETLGGADLVIIDTSAAYFTGNEELNNVQMGAHARVMRALARFPGGPCVLALCHPIKHVTDPGQLLPRGGGAFLAEVDGNLSAWKRDEDIVELHHAGKLRGPGFEPILFRLEKITAPRLVDSKGRMIPTVRAVAVGEAEEAQRARDARRDEDRLLVALLENADRSQRDLCRACGFVLKDGEPHQSKIRRVANELKTSKLIKSARSGRWALTDEGEKAAKKIKDAEAEAKTKTKIEDRGGATSSKKEFFAVRGNKCSLGVPCIHCHVADGIVYKLKDGRLRKGQGHAEALHEHCAKDFFEGKPSPEPPSPGLDLG